MLMNAPQCVHHRCPCPRISRSCPSPASPRDPPRPAGSYGPGYEGTFVLGPSVRETSDMPSKSGVCFPQSCGVPELKPHCPLKPNTLEAHSSLCKTPRLGNLTWAPELSFLWENFYGINCSLVCGLLIPGSGYGI